MTGHELARQLLALPDLEVHTEDEDRQLFSPRVCEVVDVAHPDCVAYEYHLEETADEGAYLKWFAAQPKKQAIVI